MSKADETIKQAVKESLGILAEHIQPGQRDCETTVNKLTETLDNPTVQDAIDESDAVREDAKRAATSQSDHPEDYPSPKRGSAAS